MTSNRCEWANIIIFFLPICDHDAARDLELNSRLNWAGVSECVIVCICVRIYCVCAYELVNIGTVCSVREYTHILVYNILRRFVVRNIHSTNAQNTKLCSCVLNCPTHILADDNQCGIIAN